MMLVKLSQEITPIHFYTVYCLFCFGNALQALIIKESLYNTINLTSASSKIIAKLQPIKKMIELY